MKRLRELKKIYVTHFINEKSHKQEKSFSKVPI